VKIQNKLFNILIAVIVLIFLFRSCFINSESKKQLNIYNHSDEEIDSLKALIEANEKKTDTVFKYIEKTKIKIIEVSLLNDSVEYDLQESIYKKDTTEIIKKQSYLISGLKTERDFYKQLADYSDSILLLQKEDKSNLKQSIVKLEKTLQQSENNNKKLLDKNKTKSNIIKGSIFSNLVLISILILKK